MADAGTVQAGCTVVAGNGYWGKGDTLKAAKQAFTREGGRLSNGYVILLFDPESTFHYIDGMGRMVYEGPEPEQVTVKARKVKR